MSPTIETIGEATLYLGDCFDVLPTIPAGAVDSVITDPPYGVKYDSWDHELPPQEFLTECLRVSSGAVVWFGAAVKILDFANYDPRPDRLIMWAPRFTLSHTAKDGLAYRFHPLYVWRIVPQDIIRWDIIDDPTETGNGWFHPATKPESVMRKLVAAFGGNSVVDPFMGSGTTGVAALRLGRRFVGIERVPEYFDIACRRIEAEQRQLRMF